MGAARLWKLQYASADTFSNAGTFADALRQHLRYTPAGLTSVLQQIDQEQSAYLIQAGCGGCALERCVPGCRVDLLRRVVAVGYAESQLTLVRRGLLEQPYTRMVIGWPAVHAKPLDASVLQGWQHARLRLHWHGRGRSDQGLRATAVLEVGDGADDPRERLRSIGWRAVAVPWLPPWFGKQLTSAPQLIKHSWSHDPYLLTPVAAAAHWLMTPPGRSAFVLDTTIVAAYSRAATMVDHLHEVGGRVEMIDLEPAGWTARAAVTTAAGDDPAPIWETLAVPHGPLAVQDATQGMVALDPAQARPSGLLPPLLHLGMRPDGSYRWRPLGATHHLVLSGAIEGGVILGILAPVVHGRPDLQVGILDVSTMGALAVELAELPGRVVTQDSRNPYELLSAIGCLPDTDRPVLVVLHADDAATAEAAALPVLRAALHRPLSLLLVVPSVDTIPAIMRDRCPRIVVRERQAQWQAPEGRWEWAHPTVLRLPWRDPQLRWSWSPREHREPSRSLPPVEGFWAIPFDLPEALEPRSGETTPSQLEHETPSPAASPPPDAVRPEPPTRRRCRVYAGPATTPPAAGSMEQTVPLPPAPPPDAPRPSRAAPAVPLPTSVQDQGGGRPAAHGDSAVQPVAVVDDALPDHAPYTPREDSAGNLDIDHRLLLLTLQWAEQIDPENAGVSITRFKSGVGLPSKAHSFQLRDALRLHGLIRRELKREGWYRLLTVEEAVRAGKLPPGPWYTPSSDDQARGASPTDGAAASPPDDGDCVSQTENSRLADEVPA